MKFLVFLSASLLALGAFAADDLSSMKKKKTAEIDKKMNALKEYRTCVVGATSNEIIKSCRYEGPEGMMQEEEYIDVESKKDSATKEMNNKKKSGY